MYLQRTNRVAMYSLHSGEESVSTKAFVSKYRIMTTFLTCILDDGD